MNYTIRDNKNSKPITSDYYTGYIMTLYQLLISFSTERHEAAMCGELERMRKKVMAYFKTTWYSPMQNKTFEDIILHSFYSLVKISFLLEYSNCISRRKASYSNISYLICKDDYTSLNPWCELT